MYSLYVQAAAALPALKRLAIEWEIKWKDSRSALPTISSWKKDTERGIDGARVQALAERLGLEVTLNTVRVTGNPLDALM